MPKWGYSSLSLEQEDIAKASGRDIRISQKAAREICREIRNIRLDVAKSLLQDVMEKKKPIPYRRHSKKVGHKAGFQGWYAGRYPVKASQEILKVLNALEANAENKGLDTEKLKIIHAVSQRGRPVKRFIPRAFGRSSPRFDTLCHVEFAVKEVR